MRRGIGTGVLLIVTLAMSMLTFQGASSAPTEGKNGAVSPSPSLSDVPLPGSPSPKNCDVENDSGCERCGEFCPERALLDMVSGFFGHDGSDTDAAKHWGVPSSASGDTKFVVAIVPDPVHTHLSLFFDRSIDAIGEAAQQAGYIFDRATMPWDYREYPESTDYRLRKAQQNYERVAEQLPGLMIFRPANPEAAARPSSDGSSGSALPNAALFVFVVGETPTGGIHKDQFENSLLRMEIIRKGSARGSEERNKRTQTLPQDAANGRSANKPTTARVEHKGDNAGSLLILGPTFSGSLYSLKELLVHNRTALFPSVFVHSGTVTSWEDVDWLDQQQLSGLHFVTFQESDRYSLRQFIHFAKKQGYNPSDIAILSEAETAYGNFNGARSQGRCDAAERTLQDCRKQSNGSCEQQQQALELCKTKEQEDQQENQQEEEVVRLYFPREISQLRTAYQRDLGAGEKTDSTARQPAPRSTLRLNLEDNGSDEDSVPSYSHLQTPLSEEAVLLGIATSLRAHHSQFVLLRASSPLDQLFLARYLRSAYPEGRIVTSGADLLFRRETDSSLLHGILALTSYSLIPRTDDSTATPLTNQKSQPHADRIFPSSYSAGTYNAMLSLLACSDRGSSTDKTTQCEGDNQRDQSGRVSNLPIGHYAEYGWPSIGGFEAGEPAGIAAPPLKLTVLANDGYWNLALLDSKDYTSTSTTLYSNLHSEAKPANPDTVFTQHVHLPWKLLCGICTGIAVAFLLLIFCGSALSASEAFANFAPLPDLRRDYLLLVASLLQVVMALCLLWPWERWTSQPVWLHGRDGRFWILISWFVFLGFYWVIRCQGKRRWESVALWSGLFANLVLIWLWWRSARSALEFIGWWQREWWLLVLLLLSIISYLIYRRFVGAIFFVVSVVLINCGFKRFWWGPDSYVNGVLYRYVHILSGVSPLLPWLLLLAAGLWWVWYSLAGLALLDQRRPWLPLRLSNPAFFSLTEEGNEKISAVLRPASLDLRVHLAPILLIALTLLVVDARHPLQSVERMPYDQSYGLGLLVIVFVLLCTLLRLTVAWLECRRLLVALNNFPLQRAFKRLKGFSWGPIWRVRGSVFQDSLQMVAREVNSFRHLASFVASDADEGLYLTRGYKKTDDNWHGLEKAYEDASMASRNWIESLWRQSTEFSQAMLKSGRSIPKQWTRRAWKEWAKELRTRVLRIHEVWSGPSRAQAIVISKFKRLQLRLARNCGLALCFLEFKWRKEESKSQESLKTGNVLDPQLDTLAAEEFVCLVYSNFILTVLMRMRSLVMSVAGMFVFLVLSISSYPFEPKQALRSLLVVLFVVIGGFVAFVSAQMHRDATLSRITDTKPGELGVDFWLRLAGFGAVPLISILIAQYPELNSFLFSWLQPALEALK